MLAPVIYSGNEMAILMHELTHGVGGLRQFYSAVVSLANSSSRDAEIARKAIKRASKANPAHVEEETVAYFVDEAVRAGLKPKTDMGLLGKVWNFLVSALRRFGLVKQDHLTAQSMLDMVYSLARSNWVGTSELGGAFAATDRAPAPERQLLNLRGEIAKLAQQEYDSWEQDEEGVNEELGTGGICDGVCRAIQDLLVDNGFTVKDGGQDGDDHAFTFAYKDGKAYGVDIPPHVYESGGGYSWVKKGGVVFEPSDIAIWEVDPNDVFELEELEDEPFAASDRVNNQFKLAANSLNPLQSELGQILQQTLKDGWGRYGLSWYTMDQLVDRLGNAFAKKVRDVRNAIESMANDRIQTASEIEYKWAKLPAPVQKQLSFVMRMARRAQYDPAAGAPEGLASQLRSGSIVYQKSQKHIWDVYQALPESAKKIYVAVRDYYKEDMDTALAITKELHEDLKNRQSGKKIAENEEALGSLERLMDRLKKPYFPFKRYGEWHVVGMSPELRELEARKDEPEFTKVDAERLRSLRKNENHYIVKGAKSIAEAIQIERELKQKLGWAEHRQNQYHQDTSIANMLPGVGQLREKLQNRGLSQGAIDATVAMYQEMVWELLPDNHALKANLRSKETYGEEEDMRAVFAQTAKASAHRLSRLKYNGKMSEAMAELEADSKGEGKARERALYNEIAKRAEQAMIYKPTPMADTLSEWSFFAHLGASPAFLLTNLHQVPVITLPWLAARIKGKNRYSTVAKELWKGAKDIKRLIKFSMSGADLRSEIDLGAEEERIAKMPAGPAKVNAQDELDLLRFLVDRNLLNITMNHDLGAAVDIGTTKNPILRHGKTIMQSMAMPIHATEYLNRGATGFAAYRLGLKEHNGNKEKAREFAARIVQDTQINYSSLNTPRAMQTALGSRALAKLVFQFWRYRQGMVYLTMSSIHDSFLGKDDETKLVAQRSAAGLLATTALSAGIFEIPLMAGGLSALSLFAGLGGAGGDDEDVDFQRSIRNWMQDINPELEQLLSKGVWSLAGVDMSKRLGLGDILNPLSFARFGGGSKTGREYAGEALIVAGGAPASMVANMIDGLMLMGEGEYQKGIEKVVPLKMAKDILRAAELDSSGLTTRTGETVFGADQVGMGEKIARLMGLQPMKLSNYYEGNAAIQANKQKAQGTRNRLIREYAQARIQGEDVADILEDIQSYNARNPEERIKKDGLLKAVKARRDMMRKRNEYGVVEDKNSSPYLESARFAK